MNGLYKVTNPNTDQPLGGRYKIIGELGEGGFGQTFLAEDLHLPDSPQCVVKQLKPQVNDAESLETARRLFDVEARVLYQLGNHDKIPRLLAHFEENEEFYLAQELISGEPLTKELAGGQIWSEARVIEFLQDLLQVLAFVHEQQVIHRDIKPSNLIRRREDGRIVLIDFGAVKQVSTQGANRQSGNTKTISIGTQGYTPKEQLGGNPRFSSDIYAVGVMAIQALTGIHPRDLRENAQSGELEWRDRAPQVSLELADFLDFMVRYDFRARYPTAAEALEALRSLQSARTEFVPLSQQASEPTEELTKLAPQPPSPPTSTTPSGTGRSQTNSWVPTVTSLTSQPTTEPTGSGRDRSSANGWTPTPHPVGDQPTTNSTGPTTPVQSQHSQHWSSSPVPTGVPPEPERRKSVKLLPILTVLLLAGGGAFFLTKTDIYPQLLSRISDDSSTTTASPPGSPTEKLEDPSPASSPTASPSVSSSEKSEEPSPTSSPTASSTVSPRVSPSEKSEEPSPSPTRSPTTATTTKASPAPAPSAAKPASPPTRPIAKPGAKPTAKPRLAPLPQEPSVSELMSQADRLRQAGQYQQAVSLYDQVIARKPDSAEAHWGRCYSLNSLQQADEALAACNQALALKPDYPEALWSKGNALDQQQRFGDSLPLYQQATALKPDFPEAWNNKGVALLALGRASEAVDAFDQATALKPDFAEAWANRGAALWELQRFGMAIASLEKALAIQPDNATANNLRQQAREKLGR